MDLEDIKELVDDAEASTSATREEAGDMLVFGRISQWDDDIGADVQTEFRGTFDIIKSRRNRIIAELWSNPVDITFKPKDGADPEAAETLTGMYRTDMLRSEEAIETALQDQVDCGFGAFRYVTEYESKFDDLNNYQRICAEPISEANNVVYWDSNAKKKDKSDARWCMIITTFTEKGWQRYCEENGIDYDENEKPQPFKTPHKSDVAFWRSKQDEIKIGEFYHKEKKRERVLVYEDPLGQVKAVYQREVKDVIDDMEAAGFVKVGEKMKERWVVKKHIVSGEDIIKTQRIAGEHIPVVAIYGDWSRVEGREIWRGIYHDAQDPQRLHNFMMSYLADIVAKGPRQKPIFYPGQIQGYEYMYTLSGADNNYPYMLQNEVSPETKQPYPVGPVGYLEPPQLPQAGSALLEMTRRSVDDVTGGSLNQEAMLSGAVTEGQIRATQSAQNLETFLFQNNFQLAMKQAGRVYASMAAELYDVPRPAVVTQPDGTESEVMVMEAVFDEETGEEVVINDITRGAFEVYADVGPSFQTQREEAKAQMQELFTALQGTPEGQIALYTYFTLQTGPETKHLKDYGRKQLILQGIVEPDTEEEIMMLHQAQQAGQQPDANMVLAMAEQMKAQADIMGAQANAQDDQAQRQIDAFKAETQRLDAMAKAQKYGVEAAKISTEIRGTELDNLQKFQQALMPASMRQQ
jgi:hypothetical protein